MRQAVGWREMLFGSSLEWPALHCFKFNGQLTLIKSVL